MWIKAIVDDSALGYKKGDEFKVIDGCFYDSDSDCRDFEMNKEDFIIIEPKTTGPVREKVVKEIVSGDYGSVTVCGVDEKLVQIRLSAQTPGLSSWYTSKELRSAAETFLAIADALEGK